MALPGLRQSFRQSVSISPEEKCNRLLSHEDTAAMTGISVRDLCADLLILFFMNKTKPRQIPTAQA